MPIFLFVSAALVFMSQANLAMTAPHMPAIVEAEALAGFRSQSMGVVIRAAPLDKLPVSQDVYPSGEPAENAHLPLGGNVLVSGTVATELGVQSGDTITLAKPDGKVTPFGPMPRIWRFRVIGKTDDTTHALVHMSASDAERFLTPGSE